MDPEAQTPADPAVQDPAPTPDPPATGPWAEDLAKHFEDPAQRAAVDAFLRSTVQPYSTKLEQQLADLKPAEQLYSDLVASPADTFLALSQELFGDDATKLVEEQLTTLFSDPEDPPVTEPENTPPARDPEDQAAIDWAKQQAVQQQYDAELARTKDANPDVPAEDWDLFHPFVASAQGDFDAAANGFNAWRQQVESRYKPADPEAAPDPEPPATLAENTPPAPPVEQKFSNIDDAVDAFFDEQRAGAPPVVGSV